MDKSKSNTKKAFVTGFPISQSKSPKIHGYWIDQLDINGSYEAIEISPDKLPLFIDALRDENSEYCGGNFTIPHKEEVFKLVDEVDKTAEKIGAVNTIYKKDGKLIGSNTDAYGFAANLDDFAPSWKNGKKVAILGAGGASRAVIFALLQAGFQNIEIFNRTIARAQGLSDEFGPKVRAFGIEEVNNGLENADLFVNTSSLGMNGTKVPDLDFSKMSEHALVTDIVYTPLITPILDMAQKQGKPIIDGFGMLLHQAVPGFEHWFGQRPKVDKNLREFILKLAAN